MKTNRTEKNGLVKTLLATALIVGAVAAVSQGITQAVVATEIKKVESIPTSYTIPLNMQEQAEESNVPEGYVKPNYTVVDNDSEYYNDKPTANDISRDYAAEIGVQALWPIFNTDLNGKEIVMTYMSAEDGLRAAWMGEWKLDDNRQYRFSVDAITGEVRYVSLERVLEVDVPIGYDEALANNTQKVEEIARKYAEQFDVVNGPIESVFDIGQGAYANDPLIWVDMVGENGLRARIDLSRYDNALLGICYEPWFKECDKEWVLIEEFEQRAEEFFKNNPDADFYEE